MAGQMFMRVDEVSEELGVSKPYLTDMMPNRIHLFMVHLA